MVKIHFVAVMTAVSLALPGVHANERKADQLTGSDAVVRGASDGKELGKDRFLGSVITFTTDKVSGTDRGGTEFLSAVYTLDTSRKPWAIRMTSITPKATEYTDGI